MTWAADALCDDCWAKAHPLRPALSADWDDESFEHRDRLLLIFCRTECRTIYRRMAASDPRAGRLHHDEDRGRFSVWPAE